MTYSFAYAPNSDNAGNIISLDGALQNASAVLQFVSDRAGGYSPAEAHATEPASAPAMSDQSKTDVYNATPHNLVDQLVLTYRESGFIVIGLVFGLVLICIGLIFILLPHAENVKSTVTKLKGVVS